MVEFAGFIIVMDFIIRHFSRRFLSLLPKLQNFINYLKSMLYFDYFQFLFLNSRILYLILFEIISQKYLLIMMAGGWNFNLLIRIMISIMKIRKFVIETEDFIVNCFGCFRYFEGSD